MGEGGGDEPVPPLKRNNSALNVAKFLKKTISKHNLLANAPESPEAHTHNQHAQLNGQGPSAGADHAHTNGHAHAGPEQHNGCSTDPNQKHVRKKESCLLLATVTEESNGDGETDRLSDSNRCRQELCLHAQKLLIGLNILRGNLDPCSHGRRSRS